MNRPRPDPFSSVTGVGQETQKSTAYFYDNHRRGRPDDAVIQHTLSGAGFFTDAAGRRLAPPGHATLFTHDEPSFYGYPPEATEPYRLRYVSFRLAALRPWFDRLRAEFGALVRMSPDGEASALLAEVIRRFDRKEFRDRFQQTDLLHQLVVALYREQVSATQTHDPVEYGYHQLRDNFRSPLNLKQVAEKCGISREHFIRVFSKKYGEPPGELLRRLRLEQADRMLRATQTPVQDIALACGFADANTFCRAYRQKYGTPPGQSRKPNAP
jgi:AraC-like DNA-binding protein